MGGELYSLADRMKVIKPSPTMALNALAKSMQADGMDVVNLTAGETDFSTDESIQAAAVQAMKDGRTRYTPPHGISELRTKVADWFQRRYNLTYQSEQVTVTAGVKQGLFNLMLSLIGPGDEVIIPCPYWVSYPAMVELAGGTPVYVPCDPEDGFRLVPERVKEAITSKSRMLIINSPNNPTGAMQTQNDLRSIAEMLEGTNIIVASDEIYSELTYVEDKFISFAALSEDAYRRTITFNGLSKSHAMTGWRVGFAAGDASIIKSLGILQSQSVSNITSFVQDAAIEALNLPSSSFSEMREVMRTRRDRVTDILKVENDIILLSPEGAFYCFPDMSAWFGKTSPKGMKIKDCSSLSEYFLQEALVATVPGIAFGEESCIRISFATDLDTLNKGIDRILSALQKLSD